LNDKLQKIIYYVCFFYKMSQPTPYTQTILLDANRLSSEEFSASNLADSNPSVFTNKVSNGITLDIGDQVSIQSAHIAQRGAGADVIEMKGRNLGKKTINYTKLTNSSFVGFNLDTTQSPIRYSPTGFAKQVAENIDEEVDMKDNEATIVIEYYKNSNGENCFSLPRNWGNASNRNASIAGYGTSGSFATAEEYWEQPDGYPLGLNTCGLYPAFTFNSFSESNTGDWGLFSLYRSVSGVEISARKIKMDNSRFTLFKKETTIYNGSECSAADVQSYLRGQGAIGQGPDPATHNYVRYKEKKTLTIKEGYNAPSNIASQITDQLQSTETPKALVEPDGSGVVYSVTSNTNKPLPCANYEIFNSSCAAEFFNTTTYSNHQPVNTGVHPRENSSAVAYLNNYDYVGFKRPDLVEAGREGFTYHGADLKLYALGGVNNPKETGFLYTSWVWEQSRLDRIQRFFDSQKMYPELLDGGVDNYNRTNYKTFNPNSASFAEDFRKIGRFLHIDINKQGSQGSGDPLGSDNYNVSSAKSDNDPNNKMSAPIFIYFNEGSRDLKADDPKVAKWSNLTTQDPPRPEQLASGFAFIWKDPGDGREKIGITTELIGGVPDLLINHDGTEIDLDTKIGYDHHFNAYGNAAIGLSSGFYPLQYFGHQKYDSADYILNTYVGANNPLINFNNVEARFEITNLHTPEATGNFYNAGDPLAPAGILAPPPTGQAAESVYFINKPERYVSWSPSMMPYPEINLSGTTASDNVTSFIKVNDQLQGSIYDSHGGIAIVDMGVDEKNFESSIWGLLGFTYNQFNTDPPDAVDYSSNRFTGTTVNTSGVTTNADINSVTAQKYLQNVFSIPMEKPMLSSNIFYFNNKQSLNKLLSASYTVTPTTSIQQVSTAIQATNLPRKILRGYFLVNSDILDQAQYYQLANPLQTMAIVGKYNSADDFVNYGGGGPVFTCTRKKTITDIKTQILDPEGELAQVGDNSGVIYRIDKQIKTDLKFGENLLAGMYGPTPK
jgi:hypothetical protein